MPHRDAQHERKCLKSWETYNRTLKPHADDRKKQLVREFEDTLLQSLVTEWTLSARTPQVGVTLEQLVTDSALRRSLPVPVAHLFDGLYNRQPLTRILARGTDGAPACVPMDTICDRLYKRVSSSLFGSLYKTYLDYCADLLVQAADGAV